MGKELTPELAGLTLLLLIHIKKGPGGTKSQQTGITGPEQAADQCWQQDELAGPKKCISHSFLQCCPGWDLLGNLLPRLSVPSGTNSSSPLLSGCSQVEAQFFLGGELEPRETGPLRVGREVERENQPV